MARTNRKRSQPAIPREGLIWPNLLYFLAGVLLCGLASYVWFMRPFHSPSSGTGTASWNGATHTVPPWGDLEITPILLERPEGLPATPVTDPAPTQWYFVRQTVPQLTEFLAQCGLTEQQLQLLTETNQWQISSTEIVITPPDEVVRDLAPAARQRIYRALSKSPKGSAYRYPYYTSQDFARWFAGCSLSQEKLDLIQRLTYPRNGLLCFSDADYLQRMFSAEEMRAVSQALSRVTSLLVRLRITPESDIDALLRYWGSSSRSRQIRPLLESAKRVPEGTTLNISWCFPPVPRLLLYSYPNPTNTILGKYPDCFWTALNFFNETPDNSLMGETAGEILKTAYERIARPEKFGDLIVLFHREGDDMITVHTCVFIADGIVFTKNGYDPRQPYVLMRMEDMMFGYVSEQPLGMAAFRKKHR